MTSMLSAGTPLATLVGSCAGIESVTMKSSPGSTVLSSAKLILKVEEATPSAKVTNPVGNEPLAKSSAVTELPGAALTV